VEEFVVRVFTGGKVTVPKQLRERFCVLDGDYVRLVLRMSLWIQQTWWRTQI